MRRQRRKTSKKKPYSLLGIVVLAVALCGYIMWRQDIGFFTPDASQGLYAALGDSVAAGYGLEGDREASRQDALCGRSPKAYPELAARMLHMQLEHVACSGAVTAELLTSQAVGGLDMPAQVDAAFAKGTPQLISITIGANDTHWVDFIQSCYSGDCATPANTAAADSLLQPIQVSLGAALSEIKVRSHGKLPRVVVTGYYHMVAASCYGVQPNFSKDEIDWFRDQTAKLNKRLRTTAEQYAFARFAPVTFDRHDICSDPSWIQGIADMGPLHPSAEGQAAIAEAVAAAATAP